MQISEAETAPAYDGRSASEGDVSMKTLLEGREGEPTNYRMNFGIVNDGYGVPRHRHNFDQLRLPVAGQFEYAEDKILPAGWVGYFPEGAYYGPQKRHPGLEMLLLQFGSASGAGFMSRRQRKQAVATLRQQGRFENGKYLSVDSNGVEKAQAEYDVLWRAAIGADLAYPAPRYQDLVLMNPANFTWVTEDDEPGISRKNLGTFTERNLRVGFVRLERAAALIAAPKRSCDLLFLMSGAAVCQDRAYGKHTAFAIEPVDGPVHIRAAEPTEFFVVHLPEL